VSSWSCRWSTASDHGCRRGARRDIPASRGQPCASSSTGAIALEHHPDVEAWAKNDHLGFEIVYVFDGVVRKYRPDFLVRLKTGRALVLEVKGQDSPQNQAKRAALDEWVRAVTQHGGFGRWVWAVSRIPSDLADLIHTAVRPPEAGAPPV
jgi:hypothetical protein